MPKLPKAKPLNWKAPSQHKAYTKGGKRNVYQTLNKKFYDSKQWKQLRAYYITRKPLCVWCEEEGLIYPADVVDHITEISDGGDKLNINNLQGLCHKHHNQKTNWQRAKRRKRK